MCVCVRMCAYWQRGGQIFSRSAEKYQLINSDLRNSTNLSQDQHKIKHNKIKHNQIAENNHNHIIIKFYNSAISAISRKS